MVAVIAIAVVMIATIIVVENVRALSAVLDVLILGVALAVAAVPGGAAGRVSDDGILRCVAIASSVLWLRERGKLFARLRRRSVDTGVVVRHLMRASVGAGHLARF